MSDHSRPIDVADPATITPGIASNHVVDLDHNVVWVRVRATSVEVWDIWRVTRAFGDGQLQHVGGWE